MSGKLPAILEPTEQDVALLLAAKCHLGTKNVHNDMKKYMFTRRPDGILIIHIGMLWEKLLLAARVIVSVRAEDIYVTSSSIHGRRPASKISTYVGGPVNCGRFTPGTLTKSIAEPNLLICMDPRDDFQAITESSKCSLPVIAFANSHSSLRFVDVAIPCNNIGSQSIGVMCWLLTRAILRLRGALDYENPWGVIPDMFFYNEEELIQNEEDTVVATYEGGGDAHWENKATNFDTGDWSGNQVSVVGSGGSGGEGWQLGAQDAPVDTPALWSTTGNTFGSSDKTFNFDQFTNNTTAIDWAEENPEESKTLDLTPTTDVLDQMKPMKEECQAEPADNLGWGTTTPSSTSAQNWDSIKPSWN